MLVCDQTNIRSLPALNDELVTLSVSHSKIESLPELPPKLVLLNCDNCVHLTVIPKLPNTLDVFTCRSAPVSSLPDLPDSITHLDIGGTHLTEMPKLPASLMYLYCSNVSIESLPKRLPANLRNLTAYYTRFKEIPIALPKHMNTLCIPHSNPYELPEYIENPHYISISVSDMNLPVKQDSNEFTLSVSYYRRVKYEEVRILTNKRVDTIKEELMAITWHPDRVVDWCDKNAFVFED
jgi:Leucine-rich repeat (LRR) protein